MEALPINPSTLAELASKSHAYAKALHYRELQYRTDPSGCFESLININKKLDQVIMPYLFPPSFSYFLVARCCTGDP